MKLTELNAKFAAKDNIRTHLIIDCPKCRKHNIAIRISEYDKDPKYPNVWQISSEDLETLTLSPSINFKEEVGDEYATQQFVNSQTELCIAHFFIRNGEIVNA